MAFEKFSESNQGNENAEAIAPHTVTGRELKLKTEALDPKLFARPEYAAGKEKLNFEYTFSTGEVLNASEDAEGIAHIVIKRDNEIILDFQDFLPNFKFLTPTGIMKEWSRRPRKPTGEFSADPFLVYVGDMQDPKSILLLLHEIGHGQRGGGYQDVTERMRWDEINGKFQKRHAAERRELAEAISDSERNAWAESLKLARGIKKNQGVNVLEGFKNFDELQQLISAALMNYREGLGKSMIASDEGLLKNTIAKIKKKLWGEGHGTEQWQFMQTLFDKDRLKRKFVGELKTEWPDENETQS